MVLYRPHRGGFQEAMALAKEFETIDAMKEYIVQEHTDPDMGSAFSVEDIVIVEEEKYDPRNGWYTRHVCTKRYYGKNFAIPQCIGMCGAIVEKLTQETIAEKKPFAGLQSQIYKLQMPVMDNDTINLKLYRHRKSRGLTPAFLFPVCNSV